MIGTMDRATKALLIVGGLNWLSVAVGKFDLVAARGFGRTTLPARVVYGLVGGSALYALARWIQQAAGPGKAGAETATEPQTIKQVREAMTPDPTSIEPAATVVEAAKLMESEDVGSLPVVDAGRLVGIVTDRDIAVRLIARGDDPRSVTVSAIASRNPETASPAQDLDSALKLMAHRQIRRLPVTEGDHLVGMLAQADLAEEAPTQKTGKLVKEISR